AALRLRPDSHYARAEHDQHRPQRPAAQRPGLHHALRAQPAQRRRHDAVQRDDPARGHNAPAPRRVADQRLANLPSGYGLPYKPSDHWLMNYMIHNLTPTPSSVYITYDIDFVPMTSPLA